MQTGGEISRARWFRGGRAGSSAGQIAETGAEILLEKKKTAGRRTLPPNSQAQQATADRIASTLRRKFPASLKRWHRPSGWHRTREGADTVQTEVLECLDHLTAT